MALRTSIFYEIISAIGIILTSTLILIIITKTPTVMKQFKIYLLLYSCHLVALQIACGIYAPSVLHPYVFFYPMGIAKYLPPRISASIFVFSFFSAMSMYDCIIAMVMERYYAMKNLNNGKSKIAITVYMILTGSAYSYLIFSIFAIFFKPLHDYFLVPFDENLHIIQSLLGGLEDGIILDSIIIFRNPESNKLPPFVILLSIIIGFRLALIVLYLILNAVLSRQLSNQAMSRNLQNNTSMLIKMVLFQLLGIITFIGIPMIIVLSIASFVNQSTSLINYIFTVLSCFGIYDSIVTIICIKPYRKTFSNFVKKWYGYKKNGRLKSSIAPVPLQPQNRLPAIPFQS